MVWALAAVSSEQQSETLPHQQKWAEEAALAHGWRLARVIEGVSTGKAGPRRIVRDLLVELRSLDPEARPKFLLMIRADRLGRGSIVESQIALRDLRELGVSVFTRDQGHVKLDSAMDELISAATLAVARHENEVRSEKMREHYKRRAAAGKPLAHRPPYGLRIKDGKYQKDGKRGDAVREAFALRLKGEGYWRIGRRLDAMAPPHAYLVGKQTKEKHGSSEYVVQWTPTRVSRLLKNRAYIGPIVSEATFAKAQRVTEVLREGQEERRRRPWPLSGAIKCYCGRAMNGMATGGGGAWKKVRYYACRTSGNHDGKIRLVRADNLEEQFVELLRRLRASPRLVERYRKRAVMPTTSPRSLERTLRELKSKVAEIDRKRHSAWELHAAGKVKSEDVQERLDVLAAQRDDLQGRIASAQEQLALAKAVTKRDVDVAALFERATKIWAGALEPEQREIARAVSAELGGLRVGNDQKLKVGLGPKLADK